VQKEHSSQEIGRSRGGPSTKVHAVVDGHGLPVDIALTGGEVSDYQPAPQLLEGKFRRWVIADRGYDGDRIISLIEEQGSEPVLPLQ
jgi:transposase